MLTSNENRMHMGLLVVRLGLAVTLLFYAFPRLISGAGAWSLVGKEHLLHFGLSTKVLGLVILVVEALAGIGLLTGYLFRVSAVLLASVYSLYFFNFINIGYKTLPLYAAALAIACVGLFFSGPGRFAVAVKIERK